MRDRGRNRTVVCASAVVRCASFFRDSRASGSTRFAIQGFVLAFGLILASAPSGHGQARVLFNNYVSGEPVAISPGGIGGNSVYAGANYSVQLLWKAGTITNLSEFYDGNPGSSAAFTFFGSTGGSPSTDGAGLFDGGTVALGGPVGTYTMLVRAWYNTGYPSYDLAVAAGANTGRSQLFTMGATAAPTPAPITPIPSYFGVGELPLVPIIFEQPQSQTVIVGSNAVFKVSVNGVPFPSYQWRKNGLPIAGATRYMLTLTGVTTNDAGNYDVVLTNCSPCNPTVSQTAVLQVLPFSTTNLPTITQSPLSRTLGHGATTLLSFQLTGEGPFTYQWRLNGAALSGATHPTLNLTGVSPEQAGRYDVVVSGAGGSATSAPAIVALLGLQMIPNGAQRLPTLSLDCAPGTSFRLERLSDLPLGNWSLLAPVSLDSNSLHFVVPETNQLLQFYRAVPE